MEDNEDGQDGHGKRVGEQVGGREERWLATHDEAANVREISKSCKDNGQKSEEEMVLRMKRGC